MSYQLEKYVNFGLQGTLNANKRNKQISYNPLWTNFYYYDIYGYQSTLSSNIKNNNYITLIYMNINPLFLILLKITYITMIYMNINPLFLLLLKITNITMIYVSEMLLKIASYYYNIHYTGLFRKDETGKMTGNSKVQWMI